MFAISSMRPSLFRAEVSLLAPLRLLRPCWQLDSEGPAGEGRNQFKLTEMGSHREASAGFTAKTRPWSRAQRPSRASADAAKDAKVPEFSFLVLGDTKYSPECIMAWNWLEVILAFSWRGATSCSRRSTPRARNAGEAKTSCYSASRNSAAETVPKR